MKRRYVLVLLIPLVLLTTSISSSTIKVRASDQPPVIQCSDQRHGTLAIAQIGGYDPDGIVVKAIIQWGDSNIQTVTTSDQPPCGSYNWATPPQFSTNQTHAYSVSGTYSLQACLFDNSGSSICLSWTDTISVGSASSSGGHAYIL